LVQFWVIHIALSQKSRISKLPQIFPTLILSGVTHLDKSGRLAGNPARGVRGTHQEAGGDERVGRSGIRRRVPDRRQKELRYGRGDDGRVNGVASDKRGRRRVQRKGCVRRLRVFEPDRGGDGMATDGEWGGI
jgi:hypothetical protein